MSGRANRHVPDMQASSAEPLWVREGWTADHLIPPSSLFGANGLRFGPNGHLYVAQAFGSQVSEIDLKTRAVTVVSPVGGEILAPDDLAFDSRGTLYVTEVFSERVSAHTAAGHIRVVSDQIPVANGIAVHEDRLFVDEFRVGGRVLELYPDGRPPRVIAKDLVLPNALAYGPDDRLYFPLVATGEVGRVPVSGGPVEIFAAGLNIPTAVKFDLEGRLVVVQSGDGAVTRYDVPSKIGRKIGSLRTGIDNLAFSAAGDLYVSNFADGGISRLAADGAEHVLIERGLLGPFGIAVGGDGTVFVADGMSYATVSPGGVVSRPSTLLHHGFPGYVRGVAVGSDGSLYFDNSAGGVARFAPGGEAQYLATDLDQLMGLAVGANGDVIACEAGAGRVLSLAPQREPRVLARGLHRPTGLALAADGSCYVSEASTGRIVRIHDGVRSVVLEGLTEPHGLAISDDTLFVLDRGARSLHGVSLRSGKSAVIASGLPVGPAPGIVPKVLPGIPGIMPGPLSPFADLAAARDGSIVLSGDGEGSLLRVRRSDRRSGTHP
jgi:sugar lactone lactonase YvrE